MNKDLEDYFNEFNKQNKEEIVFEPAPDKINSRDKHVVNLLETNRIELKNPCVIRKKD